MHRRAAAVAAGLTLLLTGCGRLTNAASDHPAATNPATVSSVVPVKPYAVSADQNGQTLMIHIGQELIVKLGPTFAASQVSDGGVSYPPNLLGFTSKGAPFGTYVFVGRKLGSGRIQILAPGCQPGPEMGANAQGPSCPVAGPAGGASSGGPKWMFAATVKVMPLGLG